MVGDGGMYRIRGERTAKILSKKGFLRGFGQYIISYPLFPYRSS